MIMVSHLKTPLPVKVLVVILLLKLHSLTTAFNHRATSLCSVLERRSARRNVTYVTGDKLEINLMHIRANRCTWKDNETHK